MKPFAYERATDADGAVATVAARPGAAYLAGGTNLVDHLRLGIESPDMLVDVSRTLPAAIEDRPGGGLRVGAGVRNADLAGDMRVRSRYPALSQALLSGASGQLRNLATTGGNLLQRTRCPYFRELSTPCNKREPGSGCSALEGFTRNHAILGASEHCVATHPSDMAVAMLAFDAVVRVQGPGGTRELAIADLHRLPGDEPQRDVTLEHGELIVAVDLPGLPIAARSAYRKVRDRASFAFALVSVAVAVALEGDAVADVRIAFGGVAHKPWRATLAEDALRGRPATEASFRAAAHAELEDAQPLRDNAFKVPMAANALVATLRDLSARSPVMSIALPRLGAGVARLDGPQKVTGTATYAYEHPLTDPAYVVAICSTVARGRVVGIDASEAMQLAGVLVVLSHERAPALADTSDRELAILQTLDVHFRGQIVAAVVADSLEIATHAAELVRVEQQAGEHRVLLAADDPELYAPDGTDSAQGDVEAALRSAATAIDATYRTPIQHNNPLEPHTTVALWRDGWLRLYESTQSVHGVRDTLAGLFGLEDEQVHVSAPFVGGGFGSKGPVHAPTVLAAMAARALPGRPVKLALTRRQMFTLAGHRAPTIQRMRLGAGADGTLVALAHDVWQHTSRVKEFVEQATSISRMMYAAPDRRAAHRLAPLDVPAQSWMRAPGKAPGSFALECAIDELAVALRIDPIELRVRNDPPADPDSGLPWSSRNLVTCLRQGAEQFGWGGRDPLPGRRRDGSGLVGTGVAGGAYPCYSTAGSQAQIELLHDGRYAVRIGAIDVGTGTWTTLAQIAAEALGVPMEAIALDIGDTALPYSHVPGDSAGINSWGSTLWGAAAAFRDAHGSNPSPGDEITAGAADKPAEDAYSMHAFAAHFAEVRVDADSGEVRVPRMLGVFAIGRVVNPRTARSQLIGGMTFGLSMALHEQSVMDPNAGAVVTQDLADYHVAANADVGDLDARWIDELDPHVNPMGTKGIGEIGIVGSAAAIANAVFHATGVRVRDLPITPDKLLAAG